MPVPSKNWILGHVPALRHDPLGLLNACSDDVTPLRLGSTAWLLLNPADIVHVLEGSEVTYSKGRAFRFGRRLYGNSLLVSEGRTHRQQVHSIGGLFFRHAAKSFLGPAIDMTRCWLKRWPTNTPIDLWSGIVELVLAISSQAIFGSDYLPSWLTGRGSSDSDEILNCYNVAMDHVARQNFSMLPIPDWLPTPANRRYSNAIRTLDRALSQSVKRRSEGDGQGGFLDHLLAAHQADPDQVTQSQIRDQALVLLLGGYESTATALCWTIMLLSTHDEVRTRLIAEIDRVVVDESPKPADSEAMTYVGQVVSESLRLYPPPWLIPRTCVADDQLPSGWKVNSGRQLFLSPYRTQRDERHFNDPLKFDPDRFERGRPDMLRGSYFPFGLGPRHCLGEGVARTQLTLILAMLYRHHDFDLVSGRMPEPRPLLTLRPSLPIPVRIRRRL